MERMSTIPSSSSHVPLTSSVAANSQTYCRIQSFSDDLLFLIFAFLPARDLQQIERVNNLWRIVVQQKDILLWKHLIHRLWESITFNKPTEFNVLTKIEQLSLSVLKKSLVGIDLSRCIEKKDFQRMLFARLLFYPVMQRALKSEDIRFKGKYLSMYYPEWSLSITPYKASYFYMRKEISRKFINLYELCKIDWIFRFKHHSNYDEDYEEGTEAGGGWRCKFNLDYTMASTLHGQEYEWKFVEASDGIPKIQVASYPALSSFRLGDGAWGLENMHVHFRQLKTIDVDDIPVVANTVTV